MSRTLWRRAALVPGALALALAFPILADLPRNANAANASISTAIYHGSRQVHSIALTFDDGWSATRCAQIVRILRANHAQATFFPNAVYVREAPAFWKWLATQYPFGDHTATHPHMLTLSYDEQVAQIVDDRRIVERITGVPLVRVYRAPYGELDTTELRAAAVAGFPKTVEWDLNVPDIKPYSDRELIAIAERGRNGSILTMHCGPAVTVRILQPIIDYYRRKGYALVTIPQLLTGKLPAASASSSLAPSTLARYGPGLAGPRGPDAGIGATGVGAPVDAPVAAPAVRSGPGERRAGAGVGQLVSLVAGLTVLAGFGVALLLARSGHLVLGHRFRRHVGRAG